MNPIVAVSADIAEKHGRAAVLGDEQIGCAIAIEIRGDDSARAGEFHFVEANFFCNVAKALGTFVTQQSDLPALCIFADRYQIDPTVIVIINRSYSPAA